MRFLFLMCAVAMGQVETPSIGSIVDSAGRLRPVYGVAGNFVVGAPSEATGELYDSLPGIFATADEVVIRRADASEVRFPLTRVSGMRVMTADWVQVVAGGRNYALRVERGREALFVLPEPRVEARRR